MLFFTAHSLQQQVIKISLQGNDFSLDIKPYVVENLVIIKTHVYIKVNGRKTVKFISGITPPPHLPEEKQKALRVTAQ
jgi:hypothetical protein